MMLLQTPHLLKTEMVWQGPDGYDYADPVLFSHTLLLQEIVLSWCPKLSLPEAIFLILLLPEHGSLIDTAATDR